MERSREDQGGCCGNSFGTNQDSIKWLCRGARCIFMKPWAIGWVGGRGGVVEMGCYQFTLNGQVNHIILVT